VESRNLFTKECYFDCWYWREFEENRGEIS